jgi:hypothetical protein
MSAKRLSLSLALAIICSFYNNGDEEYSTAASADRRIIDHTFFYSIKPFIHQDVE